MMILYYPSPLNIPSTIYGIAAATQQAETVQSLPFKEAGGSCPSNSNSKMNSLNEFKNAMKRKVELRGELNEAEDSISKLLPKAKEAFLMSNEKADKSWIENRNKLKSKYLYGNSVRVILITC